MASMLRNSIVNTSAGMLSMIAGFASSIIVARTLGVEGTGMVAYALWFMTVATIVSDLGMPQATLRFIARDAGPGNTRSALFGKLFRRFVLASAGMAIAIAAYAFWLQTRGNPDGALVWSVTIALFLTYAYSTMAINAAQGLGQFDRSAKMTLIGSLIQPPCVLAGAFLLGPAGAVAGHCVRHLPQALDLRRYLGRSAASSGTAGTPAPQRIPAEIGKYARNNWISGSILAVFGARIELAIIGFYFTLTQVGFYSIGLTMSGMVVQLSLFIVAFVIPRFGVLHDQADDAAFAHAFEGTIRWLAIVIAPVTIGGAAIAPELIPLVFGPEFAPGVWPAIVLLVFSVPQALAAVISRAILAKNRSSDELKMTLAWCGITIAALLLVIPFFGQMGAAWVRGAANCLLLLILGIYCKRAFALDLPVKVVLKTVFAAGLCAAAATAVLGNVAGLPGLLLAIGVAAPVYLAGLLATRTLTLQDLAPLAHAARSRLRARRPS